VRGEELSKAMKTMSIGDIMPREEDDDEGHQSLFKQIHLLPQQMIIIN
jgi:hypothetical protein